MSLQYHRLGGYIAEIVYIVHYEFGQPSCLTAFRHSVMHLSCDHITMVTIQNASLIVCLIKDK